MAIRPLSVVLGAITLAYPLLVYVGLAHFEPQWIALLLAGVALARAFVARTAFWWVAAGGALVLATLGMAGNALLPLKLYPVLVNAVFLGVFATSLVHPPSAVERLARITEPSLPDHAIAYTRRVTQVWCVFFVVNGGIALGTALWGSDKLWALYNGLISYGLMGAVFGIEWLVRRRVRARMDGKAAHG